jgi:prophage DNA circulation protein
LRDLRRQVYEEIAVSVGAKLIKNSLIEMTLAHAARVLANMRFVSRDQVDDIKKLVQVAFAPAEEQAADDMDQMTYRALIELHAAVIFFLTETARPLPRMLAWQFSQVLPTLTLAQRLYYDASRADELRAENRIVHPAFAPRIGRALSH